MDLCINEDFIRSITIPYLQFPNCETWGEEHDWSFPRRWNLKFPPSQTKMQEKLLLPPAFKHSFSRAAGFASSKLQSSPGRQEFPVPADSNYLGKCQLVIKSETSFSRSWLCICSMEIVLVIMSCKKNTQEKKIIFNKSNVQTGNAQG